MARATKAMGLTANGTEQELFKLMEQGKLLAKDVMPEFAKQLRQTAHDGGALTHALQNNLSVAIGQSTFSIQQMSNAVYEGGLKDALKVILDSFNLIAPRTTDLAYLFGEVLGGAVIGLTAPVVLLGAALTDIWTLSKKFFGVNDEMSKSLLSVGASVWAIVKGFKLLLSIMKKVGAMVGVVEKVTKFISGGATAAEGVSVAGTAGGALTKAKFLPKAGPLAAMDAASRIYTHFSTADAQVKQMENFYGRVNSEDYKASEMFQGGRLASWFSSPNSQSAQTKDVNVSVKVEMDKEGNFIPTVRNIARGEIDDAESESIEKAMNSF